MNTQLDTPIGLHWFTAYEGDVEYAVNDEGVLVPLNPVVYASPIIKNLIVDTGKAAYLDRLSGLGSVAAFGHVGVGDSATATAAGNTRLIATTNALVKACDATFPSRASLVLTFRATFATSEANFTWNEAAIFNGTVNGTSTMFNRVLTGGFAKTSSVSIIYTTQITQG